MSNFGIIKNDKLIGWLTFSNVIRREHAYYILNLLKEIKQKGDVKLVKTYEVGYNPDDKAQKIHLISYECGDTLYKCSESMFQRAMKQTC